MTKDNNKLGEFQLDGIEPAPRGVPKIEVTYDISADGILHITACDKASGTEKDITITNDKGRLSADNIERMVQEAGQFKKQDEEKKEIIKAKNTIEYIIKHRKKEKRNDELKYKLNDNDIENDNKKETEDE